MTEINAIQGDITRSRVDAIVNAANSSLMGGGGVDGAIHGAGGPAILEECRRIVARQGHLPTGEAVATTAGLMPARYVIHTVGPIWGRVSRDEAVRLLGSCYGRSLDLAVELECRTIAFPNISTGVYGFPKPLAAETAIAVTRSWVASSAGELDSITFVCFDTENLDLYRSLLES